jgi:hypothetical protein
MATTLVSVVENWVLLSNPIKPKIKKNAFIMNFITRILSIVINIAMVPQPFEDRNTVYL